MSDKYYSWRNLSHSLRLPYFRCWIDHTGVAVGLDGQLAPVSLPKQNAMDFGCS
jgi:hypothetical protein